MLLNILEEEKTSNDMIPKIVHYCWFGNNQIPPKYQSFINKWKEILHDYDFIVWNEDNFDVNKYSFTRDAYKAGNYAFVSDFVRCYALYTYGGFYFDTDVEIVKPLDVFLKERAVLGIEDTEGGILTSFMAVEPKHPLLLSMHKEYLNRKYILDDGSINSEVINKTLLKVITPLGFKSIDTFQELPDGIKVFTSDYFSVYSLVTGKLNRTDNTYAIHWHSLLWVNKKTRIIKFLRLKVLVPLLGRDNYQKLQKKIKSFIK